MTASDLFADALPIDEQIWSERFSQTSPDVSQHQSQTLPRTTMLFLAGKATREEKREEAYEGLCRDFETNVNLHGGLLQAGCSIYPIHENAPNASRFKPVLWSDVDPIGYIGIVRDWELSNCLDKNRLDREAGRSSREDRDCWRNVARIYERLLAENRLRIQRTEADIDNDQSVEIVFRFAIDARDTCYSLDGSSDYRWTYVLAGDSARARSFNTKLQRGVLFVYDGDQGPSTFIWQEGGYITAGRTIPSVANRNYSRPDRYVIEQICAWTLKRSHR